MPLRIDMESQNHPIEKENHLNQTSIVVLHLNFPGCNVLVDALEHSEIVGQTLVPHYHFFRKMA